MVEHASVDALDGSEDAREAVTRLFEAHGPRLYGMALRFCGNADEARDLVQETFLQAYRHWDDFEGRSKATTWLYTIARRACQRFHRKRAGEPPRIESLDAPAGADQIDDHVPFDAPRIGVATPDGGPLDAVLRREARELMEAAIAGLPDDFRIPFVLKEVAGFSLADIAAVTGVREATVKTRLHRARLHARRALEEALPKREVAQAIFPMRVCMDLLAAKQAALDEGEPFRFPDDAICERCAAVFQTLDLGRDLCAEIGRAGVPPAELEEIREAIEDAMAA